MTSLRSRLTVLLVVAIFSVVGLSALIAVQVLERPDRMAFAQAFAEEVRIVGRILAEDPGAAERLGIRTGPEPQGSPDMRMRDARGIMETLGGEGIAPSVRILGDEESRTRELAFEFAPGRWAFLPYPGFPPRVTGAFVSYLALVALGTILVALFTATKMTRPLRVLDEAVRTIGPDGLPAHLPEDGPAEMRAAAAAVNRLTQRVRTAVETRMRLVAAAGHDLRTPMTRMRLRAEFLPEEDRETWLKDLAELDAIADSAIRLVREEADPASRTPVALDALLEEIVGELREIGRPARFGARAPAIVAAPPQALKRALRNLVDNAAIHGGAAEVSLSLDEGTALVRIVDEGPGIPQDLIPRVFEPFFRVDPARRKLSPGAGLGLAIAKEIVDRTGGALTIGNRPGGGLEQLVRLPLAAQAAPA